MRKRHITKLGSLLIAVGFAGLVVAFVQWRQQIHRVPPPIATQHSVYAPTPPSSVKPNPATVDNYQVPPLNPKYIYIPAIGVAKVRILQLGLRGDGTIATPGNIYDAGWYSASSKPGQTGAMFIFGHVSSWQAKGVFYNLKKLSRGDRISITSGNNTTYIYQVDHTSIYPHDQVSMQQVLAPVDPAVPSLSLMTCTGNVIKGTSEFNQRLVVFAKLTAQ